MFSKDVLDKIVICDDERLGLDDPEGLIDKMEITFAQFYAYLLDRIKDETHDGPGT